VFMEYLPHRIDGAALLGDEALVLRLLGESRSPTISHSRSPVRPRAVTRHCAADCWSAGPA